MPDELRSALGETLAVEFVPAEHFAVAASGIAAGQPQHHVAWIAIKRNEYPGDRGLLDTLVHELMHAVTGFGHITVAPSVMKIDEWGDGLPLTPIDRDALLALHTRLDAGDDPTAFGAWDSTALTIVGQRAHASFGVARRNGHAEPWGHGFRPATPLATNPTLSGRVLWEGTLLGLTPSDAAVSGEAALQVDLTSMTGQAAFTGLESWGPNQAPGIAGSGTTWLDGDLRYAIAVRGNSYRETGGDAGRLTGIFVGAQHEGTTGTLVRSDLTGAFGASR